MSIYQEEMMRKLPKLGCTGTLDEAMGTLSIMQNGVWSKSVDLLLSLSKNTHQAKMGVFSTD